VLAKSLAARPDGGEPVFDFYVNNDDVGVVTITPSPNNSRWRALI